MILKNLFVIFSAEVAAKVPGGVPTNISTSIFTGKGIHNSHCFLHLNVKPAELSSAMPSFILHSLHRNVCDIY